MKQIFKLTACALFSLAVSSVGNAECNINLSIVRVPQTEAVPAAAENYMVTKLQNIMTSDGISVDESSNQFFIAGRFTHIMEDVIPGPPSQMALHTTLTLYIGDIQSETVYATTILDLRGVGTSSERAYINSMRLLNGQNKTIAAFISSAKKKIISYFDSNFPQILAQADRAAAQHNYDEALWKLSMIPECSKGYKQASETSLKMFQSYIDQQGTALLARANAIWSSGHDAEAASDAFGYLVQIDPDTSAYPQALALATEIKSSVKSDRDFELRQKYNDAIDIEKRRIEAAREVGVAYGKGQQQHTTNLMWLH